MRRDLRVRRASRGQDSRVSAGAVGRAEANALEPRRTETTCSPRRDVRARHKGTFAIAGLVAVAALAWPASAQASPGLDGPRNLAMGRSARASSTGTMAMIANPSGLSMSGQFAVEPVYQAAIQDNTHGLGIFVSDSLNNSRFALGLGYVFTKGAPSLRYTDGMGVRRSLALSHFGHEVMGVISLTIVKQWLSLAVKPKYQYTSLRYLDDENDAKDFRKPINAFGLDVSTTINAAGWVRIAFLGENLVMAGDPNWRDAATIELDGVAVDATGGSIDPRGVRRVSDYPRTFAHSVAVFPLGNPQFSLNVDGWYDFTSYWSKDDKVVRPVVGGSGEFYAGPVPIRVGAVWDGRGRGGDDDRVYVSGGLGFVKAAPVGGLGVDATIGFMQQVAGDSLPPELGYSKLETILGVNIGLRIHPDL